MKMRMVVSQEAELLAQWRAEKGWRRGSQWTPEERRRFNAKPLVLNSIGPKQSTSGSTCKSEPEAMPKEVKR